MTEKVHGYMPLGGVVVVEAGIYPRRERSENQHAEKMRGTLVIVVKIACIDVIEVASWEECGLIGLHVLRPRHHSIFQSKSLSLISSLRQAWTIIWFYLARQTGCFHVDLFMSSRNKDNKLRENTDQGSHSSYMGWQTISTLPASHGFLL